MRPQFSTESLNVVALLVHLDLVHELVVRLPDLESDLHDMTLQMLGKTPIPGK